MANRIFLALDLDDEARRRLQAAQDKLSRCGGKIRWVAPRNIHITLCFLGDIGDDLLAEACRAAEQVASRHEPFDFEVRGVQCIPPSGRLRMLWTTSPDTDGKITSLQAGLAETLSALGLPKEDRKFLPHATLARVKFVKDAAALRRAAAELADTDFGTVGAAQVVVYSSELGPDGPTYTPVATARLGGA